MVRRLAVLSLHTSPLAQPGSGDSGGMNVYVRELVSALAQAGVASDVYTRRWADHLPDVVDVEPGFRVVHVPAGSVDLPKEALPEIVDEFADGVLAHLTGDDAADALHANYWLSGVAGHRLKHELDLPLVSTFHTLARVKAETGDAEPQRRTDAEAQVIGCSDAILANCTAEAAQLVRLYGADPDRIEIVPPGVVHAFFSPGDRAGARAALSHLGPFPGPVLLFVGQDPAAQGPRRGGPGAGRARRRRRGARRRRRRQRGGRPGRGRPHPEAGGIPGRERAGAVRRPAAPPHAVDVLPGGRRRARPQPQRVVRAGGPGGRRLRDPGRRGRGRRPAHAGRPRPHGVPRRRPRREPTTPPTPSGSCATPPSPTPCRPRPPCGPATSPGRRPPAASAGSTPTSPPAPRSPAPAEPGHGSTTTSSPSITGPGLTTRA